MKELELQRPNTIYLGIILISYSFSFPLCSLYSSLFSKVSKRMYPISKIEKQGLNSPAETTLLCQNGLLEDLCIWLCSLLLRTKARSGPELAFEKEILWPFSLTPFCGNTQKPTKWKLVKAIYSKLAIERESASIAVFWQRCEGRQGSRKLYSGQRKALDVLWGEAIGTGEL